MIKTSSRVAPLLLPIIGLVLWHGLSLAEAKMNSCVISANKLPQYYVPEHYKLQLEPDLKSNLFFGKVEILIRYTGQLGASKWKQAGTTCAVVSEGKSRLGDILGKVGKTVLSCGGSVGSANLRKVVLNVAGPLEIDGIKLTSLDEDGQPDGKHMEFDEMCEDSRSQMLSIQLNRLLKKNSKFLLSLSFKGHLGSTQGALIRQASSQRLTSDFYPGKARYVFPSFDQPDMRAPMSLSLVLDSSLQAISSTEQISRPNLGENNNNINNKKLITFADTRPVPIYALAFAVAPKFDKLECQVSEGDTKPLVRVYVPVGKEENDIKSDIDDYSAESGSGHKKRSAKFILDLICKSVPKVEKYLRLPFPTKTLSLTTTAAAVPGKDKPQQQQQQQQQHELLAKAFGLLILDEHYLLFDDDDDDNDQEQAKLPNDERAKAIKLAMQGVLSQWVGSGLVTTDWWDDQWFVEGFVRWRAHVIANELHSEYNFETDLLLNQQIATLDEMARANSKLLSIKQDPASTKHLQQIQWSNDAPQSVWDEAQRVKESKSYDKAASLLFMLDNVIGEIIFRDTLGSLIRHNSWESTNLIELISELNNFINDNQVGQMLQSYVSILGVPVVSVRRLDKTSIELSSERYIVQQQVRGNQFNNSQLASESLVVASGDSNSDSMLVIPVNILVSDGAQRQETVQTELIGSKPVKVSLPIWFDGFNQSHWIKLNHRFNGLYRSKYDLDLFLRLGTPVKEHKMSSADKINILDDAKALLGMQKISFEGLQKLLEWFYGELDGSVLSLISRSIVPLLREHSNKLNRPLERIIQDLFLPIYNKHRYLVDENINNNNKLAQLNGRRDALTNLIWLGKHRDTTEEAIYLFKSMQINEPIPSFLQKPAYTAVMLNDSEELFDELIERLNKLSSPYECHNLVEGHLLEVLKSWSPKEQSDDLMDDRRERLLSACKFSGVDG